jgi:Protein of unknown function (DUF1549)/Protein of unknown function (DUF1553)
MTLAALSLLLFVAGSPPGVHFDTEIIPLITKAGCNSGACHGAAAGRGGFHLSLLGADPASDYEAMVLALEGRRINTVNPERSLLFAKPTGQLEHGGDTVIEENSPAAVRLLNWIRGGAARGAHRKLTSLEVEPRRLLCEELPASVPIKVVARFDAGPEEDVTAWTMFSPTDPAAVQIDELYRAQIHRRGQHVVIARFLNQVVPLQFNVPLSDSQVDLRAEARASYIDEHILRTLTELRLPVSPPVSDATWLRRVSIDLTGRLPEPSMVESFQADGNRSRLLDTLLNSDAFTDYWTLRFAKLLRLHSLPREQEGLRAYADWLRSEIACDAPLDAMAHELLTATGDSHTVGPANFGRMVGDARAQAELVGQFFLGMRLGCANCHNHPLDRWTQDDYHGLAAVFAKVDRSRQVALTARGAVTNLRTNEPAVPRIPGSHDLPEDGDHRAAVVHWVTSRDKDYFARATVNRLWKAMFGRGLVEPTDDLRDTNPATHPELLTELAEDFAHNGYRIRHTLKLIASSHTYARSGELVAGTELDDRFYAHTYRRALEPEVLVDAISDITGVTLQFEGQNESRAVKLIDPVVSAPALDVLGRCNRVGGCEENSPAAVGLPAQLHLLNGDLINSRLSSQQGRLRQLINAGKTNEAIVAEFYLRGLTRRPTADELVRWQGRLAADDPAERTRKLEDFVWSMLNSQQFREN